MFIEAVLAFGLLMCVFEFVVLSMVPPRYRLRLLGSKVACVIVHVCIFSFNLTVHWGTLLGTMGATLAFCASMLTIQIMRLIYGTVVNDVRVKRGLVGYRTEELTL